MKTHHVSGFFLSFFLLLTIPSSVLSQPPRENGRAAPSAFTVVQPDSAAERSRARVPCDPMFRTLNGVCTNNFFRLWGSTERAQSSLFFGSSSKVPTGQDLPSARDISNRLFKQSTNIFNDRNLNELATFFGQFIDHTFVATPTTSDPMPIPIPRDDPIFGNFSNGELKFFRSRRARVDFLGLFGSGSPRLASQIPRIVASQPDLRARSPGISANLPPRAQATARMGSQRQARPVPGGGPRVSPPGRPLGPNDAPPSSNFRIFSRNERPVNSLTSALDLSSVYGVDKLRNDALRASGGKLKVTSNPNGDLLPLNERELFNAPTSEKVYFLAGDHRANEHPVLLALHTIWVREHNSICDELVAKFPSMTAEVIYKTARKINTAQFQKIVFEEWYPALVGKNLPAYTGFKFFRNPSIIDFFSTAAFRVGHTMVGNQISRRGPGNTALPPLTMMDMFFRTADMTTPSGIEEFLRGAAQVNAQEIDIQVHDALRNFLFTGIPEEGIAFDLMALNLQRGRDHALPTFNEIRVRLGLPAASSMADITSNANVQSAMLSVYGNVNKVEAWVGMVAEDHAPGSSLGPTMIASWLRQFVNLRDGDRFFFRNNIFSSELRNAIPRINAIFNTNELLRTIILRNTGITSSELPPKIFFKN